MQMLCKVANVFSDVKCPVCGQGFLVYWTRLAAKNRDDQRQQLLNGLREQHTTVPGEEAHPAAFHLTADLSPVLHGEPASLPMPALLGVYS